MAFDLIFHAPMIFLFYSYLARLPSAEVGGKRFIPLETMTSMWMPRACL